MHPTGTSVRIAFLQETRQKQIYNALTQNNPQRFSPSGMKSGKELYIQATDNADLIPENRQILPAVHAVLKMNKGKKKTNQKKF